ncbi:hypothetical protein M080_7901, partial [Bacteroides fragilis str. 3397 T10]
MFFVFGCTFSIEETHKRTVGNKRNNPVGFIM